MDPQHRNAIVMLLHQHQNQLVQVHQLIDRRRQRRRRRRVRAIWVRNWISRRPQLGLYDRLMVELRNEDPRAFQEFHTRLARGSVVLQTRSTRGAHASHADH